MRNPCNLVFLVWNELKKAGGHFEGVLNSSSYHKKNCNFEKIFIKKKFKNLYKQGAIFFIVLIFLKN